MLLEDELDMEDLDEWDYERFMVKINEKINNQYGYMKFDDYQESFYKLIVKFNILRREGVNILIFMDFSFKI